MWHCPKGIANILLLANVKEQFRVTFDCHNGDEFCVHKDNGKMRHFRQSESGLHHNNLTSGEEAVFVSATANNKSKCPQEEHSKAATPSVLCERTGRPNLHHFLQMPERKESKNCPVTPANALMVEDIFGTNVGALKGRTVRRQPGKVWINLILTPAVIMDRHKLVTLAGDIVKVNEIPFMIASGTLKFGTAQAMENQKVVTAVACIEHVRDICARRGFRIAVIELDGEFEPIRAELASPGIALNIVSRGEHVPEAKRQIRTIKEHTWCMHTVFPFNKLPAQMVIQMVHASNCWLTIFPPAPGVSGEINPRELLAVASAEIDHHMHCQLECGQCPQVHEEHDNTMNVRTTTGALAVRPTREAQGGHCFHSLNGGRILNRCHHSPLPMPNEVTTRVHALAKNFEAGVTCTTANETNEDPMLDNSIAGVDQDQLKNLAHTPVECDSQPAMADNKADNEATTHNRASLGDNNGEEEQEDNKNGNNMAIVEHE